MIKIKRTKFRHFESLVKILGSEWDLGRTPSKTNHEICEWIYFLNDVLCHADRLYTCIVNGKVAGLVGYGSYCKPKKRLRKKLYRIICNKLMNHKLIQDKEALNRYYDVYDEHIATPEIKKAFDCELSIIIVAKEFKEQGIGKILFEKICAVAKKDGHTKMLISSDESCNYAFYEKNGCVLRHEKIITGGERVSAKNYIYEKNLADKKQNSFEMTKK